MHRRRFLSLLGLSTLLAAVPLTVSCGSDSSLRIGIHHWIGYGTLHLARDFRWLPRRAKLVQGSSSKESLARLLAGDVDAACLTLDEALGARAGGLPLTVVLVFNVSAGADKLLVRPDIRSLPALAGRRLGYEEGTLSALMLQAILAEAGLSRSELQLLAIPLDQQLDAWSSGQVDAMISYEPTAGLIEASGAQTLFDSRRLPETIFDVLVVRNDRINASADTLRALLVSHFQGLEHIRMNRQDAIYRLAGLQGIPPAMIQQALAGVVFPSRSANGNYLSAKDSRLRSAAEKISVLMQEQGLLPQPVVIDSLFSSRWLPDPGV
ncbi:MAG: nitrate ABC transporter substrate-binding protein [Gammaproteobacteria bacterium HGW-Gammaproteobacteria-11]|nr:MAG: nitrate ABC transporter substrate-binding protein [Gammaproteobacteria bacterium HGW-Gammaproteobacteria-11]